jgi:hypothetical protein
LAIFFWRHLRTEPIRIAFHRITYLVQQSLAAIKHINEYFMEYDITNGLLAESLSTM